MPRILGKMSPEDEFFLYGTTHIYSKFKVVGYIPSHEFQKCRYLVERLHHCYPREYEKPEIREMMSFAWNEYLTKMKRRFGTPYYLLESAVVVYLDGELLGDDRGLIGYVSQKYNLEITMDFARIAEEQILDYFSKIIEKYKRQFIYLTIAIDGHVVGSMLFMLYNDLVPQTCENFLNRCVSTRPHSYTNTPIHRYSWVQCGGFSLEHVHIPCENYAVPHDRRGVLSMCNKRRHEQNSTQFLITLNPTPWMDYNYVAFGQLIQGDEILNLIEKVSTFYESPVRKVEIANCGEFTLCPTPDEEYAKALNPPYSELFNDELKDSVDIDSILSETGFKQGKYFLKTDLRAYLPFTRYSHMFDVYFRAADYKDLEPLEEGTTMDEMEKEQKQEKLFPFTRSRQFFFRTTGETNYEKKFGHPMDFLV